MDECVDWDSVPVDFNQSLTDAFHKVCVCRDVLLSLPWTCGGSFLARMFDQVASSCPAN